MGFGFKVAAVPFHSWSPDVYQGSPSPAVAYMASGVKVAAFAGLVRVFVVAFGTQRVDWQPIVYVLAVATLIVGTVLAVVQNDVKRMMAYSSISHAGFILVGVEAATSRGTQAVLFYLAVYTFMIAGTFGVITLVGRRGDARHAIDDYRGLGRQRPLAGVRLHGLPPGADRGAADQRVLRQVRRHRGRGRRRLVLAGRRRHGDGRGRGVRLPAPRRGDVHVRRPV